MYKCTNKAPALQNNDGLASTPIFEGIREQVKSNPEVVKKIKAVFLWKVTQKGKTVTEWSEFLLSILLLSSSLLSSSISS